MPTLSVRQSSIFAAEQHDELAPLQLTELHSRCL
jgi:hypothetical protein